MNEEKKIEGCETCNVGVFHGLQVSGFMTVYCRSARLGLDDNLNYSTRSGHFKIREKYPEWCPEKDKIIKGGNRNVRS